jgi:hypothetical protein
MAGMARTTPVSTGTLAKAETTTTIQTPLDRDRIEQLAYTYWEARQGQDGGSAEEDWLRAEESLLAEQKLSVDQTLQAEAEIVRKVSKG